MRQALPVAMPRSMRMSRMDPVRRCMPDGMRKRPMRRDGAHSLECGKSAWMGGTMSAKIRRAACLTISTAGLFASATHAQSVNLLAQDCAALADPPQMLLTTGAGAPAGSTLLLAVAAPSGAVSDLSVDDPIGSRYFAVGSAQSASNGPVVALLRAPLERTLPAGQNLFVAFDNASIGTTICAQIYVVGGIGFSGSVLDALGTGTGTATAQLSATMPSAAVPELAFAAFASDAAIGAVQAPATGLGSVCAGGVCLNSAYYFSGTAGSAGVAYSGGSQTVWAGVVGAVYADDIFGNGFN